MKFEEVMKGIGQILMFFATPIFLFIVGVLGWPFIVTAGLIVGAASLVVTLILGLCSMIASLFN